MKKATYLPAVYIGSLAFLLLAGQSVSFAQRQKEQDRHSGQERSSGNPRSAEARQETPRNAFGNQRPADSRFERPQPYSGNPQAADRRRESAPGTQPNRTPHIQIGDRNGAPASVRNQPNIPQRSYDNRGADDQRRNTSYNRNPVLPQRQINDNRNSYARNDDRHEYRNGGNYGYRPAYGISYRPRYTRPPMIWEGRRYFSMYNYTYHPYRPYYYGSFFHPIGYFTAALNFGTMSFFWNNQVYRYYNGVYYQPFNSGYRVVAPPYGAGITYLPSGASTIILGNDTFYYFGGVFYYYDGNQYIITEAPPGAVVYDLPEGCTDVVVGNISYLQYNHTLFQPIVLDGRNAYEVVELDDENP